MKDQYETILYFETLLEEALQCVISTEITLNNLGDSEAGEKEHNAMMTLETKRDAVLLEYEAKLDKLYDIESLIEGLDTNPTLEACTHVLGEIKSVVQDD